MRIAQNVRSHNNYIPPHQVQAWFLDLSIENGIRCTFILNCKFFVLFIPIIIESLCPNISFSLSPSSLIHIAQLPYCNWLCKDWYNVVLCIHIHMCVIWKFNWIYCFCCVCFYSAQTFFSLHSFDWRSTRKNRYIRFDWQICTGFCCELCYWPFSSIYSKFISDLIAQLFYEFMLHLVHSIAFIQFSLVCSKLFGSRSYFGYIHWKLHCIANCVTTAHRPTNHPPAIIYFMAISIFSKYHLHAYKAN